MSFTYEISGALPVLNGFRHIHARNFARCIAPPARIYFAVDTITRSLLIRIRGALGDDEVEAIEDTLKEFSQKWARSGAVFGRGRYGEASIVLLGPPEHIKSLTELAITT
ncbi:hypothetical protein [Burkholderia sp. MSMB1459WGS]|uniref:hypothetical protein n=1 Tax=Burkholderia sp. MSMB1459WGS TaxID=1637970 RepID=UPI0012E363A7|nr:hypothetical protein [Burkholderia sp. MSMB1459WGS]